MQVELKEIEPCKFVVSYEADAGKILSKRSEVLNAFKKAPVPGFRKGKASLDAIKFSYKDQIEESLKRALSEDAFHDTVFEKKLKCYGLPQFTSIVLDSGKFNCEFTVCTKPECELPQYKDLEIPKPHEVLSSVEATEKMMQELRVRFGEQSPFAEGDFVQKGDNVIIDYQAAIDGVQVDTLCVQGEMITVGSSQLPAFDDNLLGMSIGDVRVFSVVIPETSLPSFAGKSVEFTTTLTMGSKHIPCALDDSLAAKVGKKDLEELRTAITATASAQVNNALRASINERVRAILVANTVVDVPNWLTLSEAKYLAGSAKVEFDNLSVEDQKQYLTLAEKNVKLSLTLDKIREVEPDTQLTDQEVFDLLKQQLVKSKVKDPIDVVMQELNKSGYLQILFSRIRDEYTLDFICKSVKVIE